MPPRRGSCHGGFTVIEMLLVVVVFGILLSIAYVRLTPSLDHARVNRAAAVLATDLQYARMLAVRQREPIAVIALGSAKAYRIRGRDTTVIHRERLMGPDTEFALDAFSASPLSVELFPNGVATTTTTFTLGRQGYQRQVRLTRAGQVRIIRVP
jgi:prepilin-type N-terminal cleavage/methylation domain-containing protein